MKKITYLFFIISLLLFVNCTSKSEVSNASTETSATQTDSNKNADSAEPQGSGVETNLGKVSPEVVVKELYELHKKEKSPFFDSKNRALFDKFFDKTLADYIFKDLNTERDGVGVLDFDALYNAQDFDIKNFSVSQPKITGEKAEVVASFNNFDQKQNITFSLVKKGDSWKISDIKYPSGDTLIGYFKEDEKSNTENNSTANDGANGEFEGTYKVGDTTCTVKPIKMAFEIKWAKGSGTMIFFYDSDSSGGLTYASEDTGKGRDKFVFDNENLSTGKFIRADGKEMPVSKIK